MNLDLKKRLVENGVKFGLAGAAIFLLAPFLFTVLQATVALAASVVLGLAIINFAPLVAFKMSNWSIKGIRQEARKNPIETMEGIYIEKRGALVGLKQMIESFAASVGTFETKVKELAKRYPERAAEQQEHLDKMKQLLELRWKLYGEAKTQLQTFRDKIDENKAVYEVALAAADANSQAGKFENGGKFDSMKLDESFDSVTKQMNAAFASLDSSLRELEYNPSKTLKTPVLARNVLTIDV